MDNKGGDAQLKRDALAYHEAEPKGKIKTVPTKPHATARDLTLAYSPGVAYPCLEIAEKPESAYQYTSKGNLVAVISNGTAVLGLGNIGALASKPVMEGKGLLFKTFADIDVFDIQVDTEDPQEFIDTVVRIAPTFGGINLEDIKAPECFDIEREIAKRTNIPVMHDDQHGTAIISGAALLNAAELQDKKLEDIRVVVSGAGASAIACAKLYVALGVKKENVIMCDSKGVISKARLDAGELNEHKAQFAHGEASGSLADALAGADLFLGLSRGGLLDGAAIKTMGPKPIVFALANPTPEIMPDEVTAARDDAIVATGRSDFPNQVNNVLGFPYIFRGALDVRARDVTTAMQMAACHALAALAKEPVPDSVARAYDGEKLVYGKKYIIPKPFDERVLMWVASAVAQAAVDEGIAGVKPEQYDVERHKEQLEARLGASYRTMRTVQNRVRGRGTRIVFPEGDHEKIVLAAAELVDADICHPILLGEAERIEALKKELHLDFECTIVDPSKEPAKLNAYAQALCAERARKGVSLVDAKRSMRSRIYYGAAMVKAGEADGYVGGIEQHYADILRPCLEVCGVAPKAHCVIGCYMLLTKGRVMFISDATVNIYPDARTLAEIAIQTSRVARHFLVKPRVAMLSYSNFGSTSRHRTRRIEEAIEIVNELDPELLIDGPMQADTALVESIQNDYPFMKFKGPANVLVCPNLPAANIAYKLMQRLADAELIGPILSGLAKPVHVLQRGDEVRDVVHMASICADDAFVRSSS